MPIARFAAAAMFGLILLAPVTAFAWGHEGHEIVARIAAKELTPKARAGVLALLGGSDAESAMADVASWADAVRRDRPETGPWHYVDIEIGSTGYDAARDCPNDNCVVAQIVKDEALIADKTQPQEARAEALRFLIHFVGDIHQPLHDADDHDKGGNRLLIYYNGKRFGMHSLWDEEMAEQFGSDASTVAGALDGAVTPAMRTAAMSGTPADWANEGFLIAKRDVYAHWTGQPQPLQVPESYVRDEGLVIKTQLVRAGLRLAWYLNKVFG